MLGSESAEKQCGSSGQTQGWSSFCSFLTSQNLNGIKQRIRASNPHQLSGQPVMQKQGRNEIDETRRSERGPKWCWPRLSARTLSRRSFCWSPRHWRTAWWGDGLLPHDQVVHHEHPSCSFAASGGPHDSKHEQGFKLCRVWRPQADFTLRLLLGTAGCYPIWSWKKPSWLAIVVNSQLMWLRYCNTQGQLDAALQRLSPFRASSPSQLRKVQKQETAFSFRAEGHGFRLLQPPADAYIQLVAEPLSLLRNKCETHLASDVSKRLQHKLDMVSWTMKMKECNAEGLWGPRIKPIFEIGLPLCLLAVQTLPCWQSFTFASSSARFQAMCHLPPQVPDTMVQEHTMKPFCRQCHPESKALLVVMFFSLVKLQVITIPGKFKNVMTCLPTCLARLRVLRFGMLGRGWSQGCIRCNRRATKRTHAFMFIHCNK